MSDYTQDERFNALLGQLWRGGVYGIWWQSQGRRSTWFMLDTPAAIPARDNVYFGVHPCAAIPPQSSSGNTNPTYIRSQMNYIAAVNCLFAEFDAKDYGGDKQRTIRAINMLSPGATAVIDSGGGYHVYWVLREPVCIVDAATREYMKTIQYRWVDYAGSDGGAKDIARVLRVPGTRNVKPKYAPDYPTVKMLRYFPENVYELHDLIAQLPPVMPTPARPQRQPSAIPVNDAEVVNMAAAARNGAKFNALFSGNLTGYKSQSEADAALCAILAYWSNGDAAQIDRVFRASGMMRDKWDEKHSATGDTYGQMTIAAAVML